MGRNLEYAIRGSIDDQLSGTDMLPSIIPYYICPGVWKITQRSSSGAHFKFLNNFLRKSMGIGRHCFF